MRSLIIYGNVLCSHLLGHTGPPGLHPSTAIRYCDTSSFSNYSVLGTIENNMHFFSEGYVTYIIQQCLPKKINVVCKSTITVPLLYFFCLNPSSSLMEETLNKWLVWRHWISKMIFQWTGLKVLHTLKSLHDLWSFFSTSHYYAGVLRSLKIFSCFLGWSICLQPPLLYAVLPISSPSYPNSIFYTYSMRPLALWNWPEHGTELNWYHILPLYPVFLSFTPSVISPCLILDCKFFKTGTCLHLLSL